MVRLRWWSSWVLVLSFATFCALVHAAMLVVGWYVNERLEGEGWTAELILHLVVRGGIDWYLWAILAVPIYYIVRLLLKTRLRGIPLVLVHLPVGAIFISIFVLLNSAVSAAWERISRDYPIGMDEYLRAFVSSLTYFFAVYLGIVAASYAFLYYRPALKASQLEGRLTRAKLQALQMQLHPHFLFNALNSISVLVYRDPDTADRMISRLSELLRLTLSSGDRQRVPLREELEILDKYMEIELVRFQNRLRIEKDIAPDVLGARVPAMVLQPLVENSIQHGIARRSAAGWIGISAWREGSTLILEVADDGPGAVGPPEKLIGRGVGLTNTRERLTQLYGTEQAFEIESRSLLDPERQGVDETNQPFDPGLTVRIRIPYEEDLDDSKLGSVLTGVDSSSGRGPRRERKGERSSTTPGDES